MESNDVLLYLKEVHGVSIEDVEKYKEMKKDREILERHEKQYVIRQYGRRWYTNLPDKTAKRGFRQVAKTKREDLEKAVIAYYRFMERAADPDRVTVESLYGEWMEYKAKETESNTMSRIACDWNKFYKGSKIVQTPLVDLDLPTLRGWCLDMIRKHSLKKKAYTNMQMLMRQILQYAVDKGILDKNLFVDVRIPKKMYRQEERKEDCSQVFTVEEEEKITGAAFADFEERGTTSALGVALLFQTGLRIGELLALRFSDISEDGNYIHVCRMEVRIEEEDAAGKWKEKGYEVVPYTKTEAGVRDVYLTEKAREILKMVREWNDAHGYTGEGYIFMTPDKGKAHTRQIAYRLKKYCVQSGVPLRSLHKIRKTYISALVDSHEVPINTIKVMAGHKNVRTTYDNYVFSRKTDRETEAGIERALRH